MFLPPSRRTLLFARDPAFRGSSSPWGECRSVDEGWLFVTSAPRRLPLALFLGATIWALNRDRARHERAGPERLAWAAAQSTVGGLWLSGVVMGLGLTLLVAASAWNWVLVRGLREAPSPAGEG